MNSRWERAIAAPPSPLGRSFLMPRINRAARAASVLSAAVLPLVAGCLSVPPPPPGGYVQVTAQRAPAPAPAPAPATPSGEAEPTPAPDSVAGENVPTVPEDSNPVSLPEDPAL